MIYLEPTPARTPMQTWDRIAIVFSDYLNNLEHLTDEQRGNIFTKTMDYKEALLSWERIQGHDMDDMEMHEGIADKVADRFVQHLESVEHTQAGVN